MWLDDDRAKAMAWRADQAEIHGRCGQRRSDWLGPDGQELKYPPFEVVDYYCPACAAVEEHERDTKESRIPGTFPVVREIEEWDPDDGAEDL